MEISEFDAFCSERTRPNRLLREKRLSTEENILPLLRIMMSPATDHENNAAQQRRDAACSLLAKIRRRHSRQFTELSIGNDAGLASGAAQILGRQRNPKAVKALALSLDDVKPPVLNCVIWGLGQSGNSDVIGNLSSFMRHKSKSVRASATIALGNFPGEDVTRLLVSALKDSSAKWFIREVPRDSTTERRGPLAPDPGGIGLGALARAPRNRGGGAPTNTAKLLYGCLT